MRAPASPSICSKIGGRDELEGELGGGQGVDGLGMDRLQQGAAARVTMCSFTRSFLSLSAATSSLTSSSVAAAGSRQGAKKGVRFHSRSKRTWQASLASG